MQSGDALRTDEGVLTTHTAWEVLRPRLVFFPMTGVPKCSGLVRGSWSKVYVGEQKEVNKCRMNEKHE